jgi:putative transposase
LYEKIRQDGLGVSSAVLIIQGLTLEGRIEVLAVEPIIEESESSWKSIRTNLKVRGLEEVWLVVSDARQGL